MTYRENLLYTKRFGMMDIVSVSNPLFKQNRKWDSYDDLNITANPEKLSHVRIAGRVVKIFFELVFKDMIENNTIFVFPIGNTVRMGIARNPKPKKYNIETFGEEYRPWLTFGHNFFKRCSGFYYYMNFSKGWQKKLMDQVKNGRVYSYGRAYFENMGKYKETERIIEAYDKEYNDVSNYI